MTKLKLFGITFLLTTGIASLFIFLSHSRSQSEGRGQRVLHLTQVAQGVFITTQLTPDSIRNINLPVKTVVDIRPDGEDPTQAPSSAIEEAAKANGLGFHYIPVPHDSIPDEAVEALGSVLSETKAPTLLYCRTGRRAVRLFALTEATRVKGPSLEEILQMVRFAGFTADDLQENITKRIANRNITAEAH